MDSDDTSIPHALLRGWGTRWATSLPLTGAESLIRGFTRDLQTILEHASLIPDLGTSLPMIVKMLELIHQQGGVLHIGAPDTPDSGGQWFVALEWSKEAPDSDMVGAASYSHTHTSLDAALEEVAVEAQLGMWATSLPPTQRFPVSSDEENGETS